MCKYLHIKTYKWISLANECQIKNDNNNDFSTENILQLNHKKSNLRVGKTLGLGYV